MRKLMTGVFALFGLVALTTISFSEGAHTPDQAKAFVEKAVTFYKTAGREKALAVFSDPKGEFVEGDLYIFVMDMKDGKFTTLAHGANSGVIGKPMIDLKDAEGRAFFREAAEGLAKEDKIWVDYKWPNPATKKIASKRSYFVKVDDVVIGAGVYN